MPNLEKHSQQDLTDQPKATASHPENSERLQQLRRAHGYPPDKGKGPAPARGKDRRLVNEDGKLRGKEFTLPSHYDKDSCVLLGGAGSVDREKIAEKMEYLDYDQLLIACEDGSLSDSFKGHLRNIDAAKNPNDIEAKNKGIDSCLYLMGTYDDGREGRKLSAKEKDFCRSIRIIDE